MLKGHKAPMSNAASTMTQSMTSQLDNGQEIKIPPASRHVDGVKASLDREVQARELNYRSWDLGVMRLERTPLLRRSERTHLRGIFRADDGSREEYARSGASVYLQHGSPPDLNFQIMIASLDEGTTGQLLTALLPGTLLRTSVLSRSGECMVALNSWQGEILAGHLLSLARELYSIPKEHWPMLGTATCALVRACLVPAPNTPARTDMSRVTALRERLRCIVRQNMSSPDFGPEALRRLAAMSRSKLYRVFEGTGGVARFIQDERLTAARQRLADVRDRTSIRALAGDVGFLEHSTFSRAFKLKYGSSPTEFRGMVLAHHPLDTRDDRYDAARIS